MNKYKSLITSSLLIALIVVIPIISFAENNSEKDNNNDKVEQPNHMNINSKNNSMFNRFMGWFNNHSNAETSKNIRRTELQNITAPIISNINISNIKNNKATINWITDTKANTLVWISKVPHVDTSVRQNYFRKALVLNHKIEAKKLDANTKYYIIVGSMNNSEATKSSEISFTTNGATVIPVVIDTTAPIINNIATTINTTNVTITWKTNEPATSNIFYSTSTPVDTNSVNTFRATDPALATDHSQSIPNLTSNTLYHFIIKSLDASNNAVLSSEATFTTN